MYAIDEFATAFEAKRMEILREYEILDTPPDEGLDILTRLGAGLLDMPIALISLVDSERIWFKSHFGLNFQEVAREPGFCDTAILSEGLYMVQNAEIDSRTLRNSLVCGEEGIRFYAAVPLRCKGGYNLGTYCVMDRRPRVFSSSNGKVLKDLADVVVNQLDIRFEAKVALKHQHHILNTTAHDLKNPISILPLLGDLILEHKKDPGAIADLAQQIKEAGKRMSKIVDELLIEAMEDAGGIHLQLKETALSPIVEGVVNVNVALAKKKQQELNLLIKDDCSVYADARRLTKILDNLVNNAIKFSPPKTKIEVSVWIKKPNAVIEVKDEGPGLTKDDMKNLYRKFTSLSAQPTGGENSTGLGLSIVKKLVDAHGGKIVAKSEGRNKGTSFLVELPLSETN